MSENYFGEAYVFAIHSIVLLIVATLSFIHDSLQIRSLSQQEFPDPHFRLVLIMLLLQAQIKLIL